jgi:hypothetical protein
MKKLLLPFLAILFLASCEKESMKDMQPDLKIGDAYLGGIIAYILQPGDPGYVENEFHAIIAAPSDRSEGIEFGSYPIKGATGTALGTGKANTIAIIKSLGATSFAEQLAKDLELGWYLPSKDELNKLYLNKEAIGGFADDYYWSSTVTDDNLVWIQNFKTGETRFTDQKEAQKERTRNILKSSS